MTEEKSSMWIGGLQAQNVTQEPSNTKQTANAVRKEIQS
jgi:hypothetical protein